MADTSLLRASPTAPATMSIPPSGDRVLQAARSEAPTTMLAIAADRRCAFDLRRMDVARRRVAVAFRQVRGAGLFPWPGISFPLETHLALKAKEIRAPRVDTPSPRPRCNHHFLIRAEIAWEWQPRTPGLGCSGREGAGITQLGGNRRRRETSACQACETENHERAQDGSLPNHGSTSRAQECTHASFLNDDG